MEDEGGSPSELAVAETIRRERLLAVLRLGDAGDAPAVAGAVARGGIRVIELAMSTPFVAAAIEACAAALGGDVLLGAGTVLTASDARRAVEAGARFLVAPGWDAAVADVAAELGVLHVPGALTPTEVGALRDAPLVKLFPAGRLGPGYVRDLLAPFAGLRLMPTGGVDESNAAAFLEAGAVALAVGGALAGPRAIDDLDGVTARARRLVAAVAR
jgi:2-dehydro-3-deoxyphosphogluconate aldolase / (4S)-4-hydroxy-2-oxoglutarate aldolase